MAPLMHEKTPAKPKLLRFRRRRFTDVVSRGHPIMRAVSLINLKSVRALEREIGAPAALRTQRCGATNVNPATAKRDRNLPAALARAFNRPDMGIYVEMNQGGKIAIGDAVAYASSDAAARVFPIGAGAGRITAPRRLSASN